ncbi:hypothetical protein [Cupriavidus malaysiensis]|uniref:Uncharacterized protein n=1 Tax=Cupriavidus malaysiensis TaxID=367825 RepID=A0ABN4U0I2_9BURK|nr:hypothetical protein [Cupriavidus malaysiensis]AOZ11146.1 hypothetical protein BKK80_34900 [Cupriavidus malaysiensis]
MDDSSWDKADWKARAETLATLLDSFREDARRYRHLMSLAQPEADGWHIHVPGDLEMPFAQAIDTHASATQAISALNRRR